MAKTLKERKYFDSGDYALSKAGQASSVDTGSVGSQHPLPENIPHLTSPGLGAGPGQGGSGNGNMQLGGVGGGLSGSPVKESSFLNRETSVDDAEEKGKDASDDMSVSPPLQKGGIPIKH